MKRGIDKRIAERDTFFNFLGRVPKRATIEQIRAAFGEKAEMLVQGAVSRDFMELRKDGFYYPTAAGKRALQDYRSRL